MSQKSPSFFEGEVLSKQIGSRTNTRRVATWRINKIKAANKAVANKLVVVRAISKRAASKVVVAQAVDSKVAVASKVAVVSGAATASHNLSGLNSRWAAFVAHLFFLATPNTKATQRLRKIL